MTNLQLHLGILVVNILSHSEARVNGLICCTAFTLKLKKTELSRATRVMLCSSVLIVFTKNPAVQILRRNYLNLIKI